jgi:hypothetical protein
MEISMTGAEQKQHQSMNYELAEQLRDAGFPQSGHGRHIGAPSALVWRARDLVYAPTLEELISACGDQFGEIARRDDGRFDAVARGGKPKQTDTSPTGAAARLWLALNFAHWPKI